MIAFIHSDSNIMNEHSKNNNTLVIVVKAHIILTDLWLRWNVNHNDRHNWCNGAWTIVWCNHCWQLWCIDNISQIWTFCVVIRMRWANGIQCHIFRYWFASTRIGLTNIRTQIGQRDPIEYQREILGYLETC